jgi:LytS/YehU family sensor histidine kinase
LIGHIQGMVIAALVECVHMGLVLLIARPFDEALAVVKTVMVPMIVANSLNMLACIMVLDRNFTPDKFFRSEKAPGEIEIKDVPQG